MTWEVWTVGPKPQRVFKGIKNYANAETLANLYRDNVQNFRWVAKTQYTVRRSRKPNNAKLTDSK
jgi:hypothetical protein